MVESWASSPGTRASMRANTRRDTKPELAVRRLVHAVGLRYRVDFPPLPDHRRLRADLVFTRAKVAVFIDGCFWHGCPEHHTTARTNAEFWAAKVTSNRELDARVTAMLADADWTVLRFWEHEDLMNVTSRIVEAVRARLDTQHCSRTNNS